MITYSCLYAPWQVSPRSDPTADPPAGLPTGGGIGTTMSSIVIIDDRITNRRILSELATTIDEGAQVQSFEDPLAALAWIGENTPDLVITDYKMPEIDGAEFIRRFRHLPFCFDVPVMVITIYEDREFRYRALAANSKS
jgi:CheY-like chemotaxis protein